MPAKIIHHNPYRNLKWKPLKVKEWEVRMRKEIKTTAQMNKAMTRFIIDHLGPSKIGLEKANKVLIAHKERLENRHGKELGGKKYKELIRKTEELEAAYWKLGAREGTLRKKEVEWREKTKDVLKEAEQDEIIKHVSRYARAWAVYELMKSKRSKLEIE